MEGRGLDISSCSLSNVEVGGLAKLDDRAFPVFHLLRGVGDTGGDLSGDADDPVLVTVNQVAGPDLHASDGDGTAHGFQVYVGVRDQYFRSEEVEA